MSIRKTRPAPDFNGIGEAAAAITHREGDTLTYDCTLVTPMYGGGVKAGEVDTLMPIRATAIRGQLRFWWRLLNRKRFANSHGLFEAERAIWGGLGDETSLAKSKVRVSAAVNPGQQRNLQPAATYTQRDGKVRGPDFGSYPGYALFPAQGKSERGQITEDPKLLLKEGVTFSLKLHLDPGLDPDQHAQVLTALRWWASFGGVGARTRRGCGAVQVLDAKKQLIGVGEQDVAAQGWRLVLSGSNVSATEAWGNAIGHLRDFRQKPGIARNHGQGPRPGRSRWPEPDAIRRITGDAAENHPPAHPAGNVFPRAAFGLPIITHFKQEKEWRQKDPQDTTLKPIAKGSDKPSERMASPLILRPYFDGKTWRPAVLCLDLDHIRDMGLSLEGKFRRAPHMINAGQWQVGPKADQVEPMQGRGEDAIEAFLSYFSDQKKSAGATASNPAKHQAQTRPTGATGVANVKLQLNLKNGSLEAKHIKSNKSYYARGADVEPLISSLPGAMQKELRDGRYVFCDIEVAGYDLIAVREKA